MILRCSNIIKLINQNYIKIELKKSIAFYYGVDYKLSDPKIFEEMSCFHSQMLIHIQFVKKNHVLML